MDVRSAFSELKNPPSISMSPLFIEAVVMIAAAFAVMHLI